MSQGCRCMIPAGDGLPPCGFLVPLRRALFFQGLGGLLPGFLLLVHALAHKRSSLLIDGVEFIPATAGADGFRTGAPHARARQRRPTPIQNYNRISPRLCATATASVRLMASSLVRMAFTWVFAVPSLMDSRRPMSLLLRPSASCCSTSSSRCVRLGRAMRCSALAAMAPEV